MLTSSVTSAVSIVGALLLIASYTLLPPYRTAPRRFLALLSVADLLTCSASLGLIWLSDEHAWACDAYTVSSTAFNLASFAYTTLTARVVWESVAAPHRVTWRVTRHEGAAHAAAVGAPAAVAVALAAMLPASSQRAAIGCWMPSDPARYAALRLAFTYVPLWCAMVYLTLSYISTVRAGRAAVDSLMPKGRQWRSPAAAPPAPRSYGGTDGCTPLTSPVVSDGSGSDSDCGPEAVRAIDGQLRRLVLVPILFVLLRTWGSINVVRDVALRSGADRVFWVDLLESFGDQAQAAVHCALLVFGHTGVRKALWQRLARCRDGVSW